MPRITLSVLILFAFHCSAQQLSHRQFTVRDGLPGSVVYQVLQDQKGFLWFATNQGVSRFDGRTFRNYTRENGLPGDDILKLYLDRYGNLWFISLLGEPAVLYKDSIIRFGDCKCVRTVCEDWLEDKIVFMTINYVSGYCGYYQSVNDPGRWKFSAGRIAALEKVTDLPFLKCSSAAGTNFYFSPHGRQTVILTVKDSTSEAPLPVATIRGRDNIPFSDRSRFCLVAGGKGIVFSIADSLYYADRSGLRLLLPLNSIGVDNFLNLDVNQISCEADSMLWICTRSRGLICIRNFLSPRRTISRYFEKSFCTSLFKDRENGYWITTHNDGVYYLPNLSFHEISGNATSAGSAAHCLKNLDSGRLIAGFDDGNIMVIGTRGTDCRILPAWQDKNRNNRILDIHELNGQFLFAATDAGICRISSRGKFRRSIPGIPAPKELFIRPDGSVAVACSDGVRLVSPDRRSLWGISNERAFCLTGRGYDYYWGTLHGMFSCEAGVIHNLGQRYPELSGAINHIDIAPDSAIWISTEAGIAILKAGRVWHLGKMEGLSAKLCKQVSFDGDTAWVATGSGVFRVGYRWQGASLTCTISAITQEDGLSTDDVNRTLPAGPYVWVATARGISYFSKAYTGHSPGPPLINITRIIAGGDTIPSADTLVLGHSRNKLLVELAGISFRSGKHLYYEYRLAGLDSNWNRLADNSIEFPALPFGRYVFEVRSVDKWGNRSIRPQRIVIIHPPPFWRTTWFNISSYLLMAALMGLGFYGYYRRQQVRREKGYLLERKMHQLEMMAFRAQMNPHFIFNCLTSIQYHIIRTDAQNANIYLHKFSTLIRKILQHSTASTIPLREEIRMLELYLELEKLRFGDKMDYRIVVSGDPAPDDLRIPSMIIQPYVENAVKHGVDSLKDRSGSIIVTFGCLDGYVECTIEDNGPGIDLTLPEMADRESGHVSMGTSLTAHRINTINAIQGTNIRVRIMDKKRSGNEGPGTIVKIYFPIKEY